MSSTTDTVASIVGVAGTGFRLSLILNAVSCEIADAPTEIHSISKNITLLSLLLKQTASVFDQPTSVHSREVVRSADRVLEESNAVFNEVNAMLDQVRTKRPDGTTSPSVTPNIKWCFKKHGVEYLLGRIDRLQMSLSLMLQIIQLGMTMASTSRHDSPERVREMSDRIRRERVEAQNVVVLYLFENQQLDRLYLTAREEETEQDGSVEKRKLDTESDALTLVSSRDSELTKVEELPLYTEKDVIVQPPTLVLSEFEDNWQRMGRSPEDMLKVSEDIINKLLERWTIWREKRDQGPAQLRSRDSGRYRSAVQDLHDEDDAPYFERYREREDNPAGKYLEGPTTDWRQPHSGEAREKAARLRRSYAGYQPSVEGDSDFESSPGSNASRKKSAKKHVIDSDDSTSQSEDENLRPHPRRRSSAVAIPSQPKPRVDEPPVSRSYGGNPAGPPVRPSTVTSGARPPISPTWSQFQQQRPSVTPEQGKPYHSFTTPAPPSHMYNGAYPSMPMAQSPGQYLPSSQQSYPFPQGQPSRFAPRLTPQTGRQAQQRPGSRDGPQRPASRDGRHARSPSALSREYTTAQHKEYEAEKRRQKKELRRNLGDGAAKGLLAGGGLAVLLEALDCLS